jgi:hypothetical protein
MDAVDLSRSSAGSEVRLSRDVGAEGSR